MTAEKGEFTAEWNMGKSDIERIGLACYYADESLRQVLTGNLAYVRAFYASIYTLYVNISPFIYKAKKKGSKKKGKEEPGIYSRLSELGRVIVKNEQDEEWQEVVLIKLPKLYEELLNLKQEIGLGVPAKRKRRTSGNVNKYVSGG